jgi:F-box-like
MIHFLRALNLIFSSEFRSKMDLHSSPESIETPIHDLTPEVAHLSIAAALEIGNIRQVAELHQKELRKQLEWSKEEQQANIEVVKIRLEREIERLYRERTGESVIEGPIHKLPTELLCYIFRFSVEGDTSPWALVKVCKSWMQTALATPRLWRHICATPKTEYPSRRETWVVDGEKRISQGRMQICSTVVQLHAALRRSGAVPVQINVDFTNTKSGPPLSSFLPLFQIILSNPISERIEVLTMTNLWIWPQPELLIGRFPLLREIHLPTGLDSWANSLLQSVCLTATRFDTLCLKSEITPKLVGYSFWPLLKVLKLYQLTISHFNDIADKLLNLEELPVCPRQWPDQNTPVFTWERIWSTDIMCDPTYLDRVKLPNLRSLNFTDARRRFSAGGTMIAYPPLSFPHLTQLEATTQDPRWLAKATLPLLGDLILVCDVDQEHVLPDGASFLFNPTTFPALEGLQLTSSWSDSTLVDILASLPNLVTVAFNSTRSKDKSFGLLLLNRLCTDKPLLCPNLVSLSLGNEDEPVCTPKRNVTPLLKRLVSGRKKIGKPFGSLDVYWARTYVVENYA